jgi:hypothetical protein
MEMAEQKSKYRVLVLGAGFSRAAGLPLASELWIEILERSHALTERASKFNDDLEDYLHYRKHADGIELARQEVNFEDFMQFLDIEHYLGLRGSDTWSDDGNEGTIVTKWLIGKILAEQMSKITELPKLYLDFAKQLQPHDVVITFNYDTLLERALEQVGKPYRLFPYRYKSINEMSGTVDNDKDEVLILKVHGSIDWFDRSKFEAREEYRKQHNYPAATDIIFSNERYFGVKRIVDGPRFPDDPMKSLYRISNLEEAYDEKYLFSVTPKMLAPSASKILYMRALGDFWRGFRSIGTHNFGVAIIGFSLPSQDNYARQIIYTLIRNYQHYDPGEVLDLKKSPLVLIDFFKDEKQEASYRQRYQFVSWENAVLHGKGFNEKTLGDIFA